MLVRPRHPFSEKEMELLNKLGFFERRRVRQLRERKLFDAWVNPGAGPYRPDPSLLGKDSAGWEVCLDSIIADGTDNTSGSEAICCPDFNIPAYYMAPGRTLRLYAAGTVSTAATPGAGTWRVRWGGVGGIQLCASAAQGFNTSAQTADGWNMSVYIVCRAAGSGTSGSFMTTGQLDCFDELPTTAANLLPAVMGSAGTNSNVAVGVDTTTAKLLSVTYANTVGTGHNVCQQRIIEVLN